MLGAEWVEVVARTGLTLSCVTILSALEVFPPADPFNQVVDQWPLHPNSKNIVASIGEGKPFRYNTDMAFVLVPPDQPRVAVNIVEYSGEPDAGPFPVPDDIPIEGWPVSYQRTSKDRPTLSQVQLRPAKYEGDPLRKPADR